MSISSNGAPGGELTPPIVGLGRATLLENRYFRIHKDPIRKASGAEGVHWVIDYKRYGVGVVPILPDRRVVLGLHHRYTTDFWDWEIAAGGCEPGESIEATAHRELEEETGYRAGRMMFLLDYYPAPGLGTEHFHLFAAEELTPIERELDSDEILEVRAFTWGEVEDLFRQRQILDGFSVTGLHVARARGLL